MKEQYIKRVRKLLKVPGQKKQEILRDLEEAFASGAEHGETAQQVAGRLGTPEEFAASMTEPSDEAAFRRQRIRRRLWAALLLCAAAFVLRAVLLSSWQISLGIIGGADGPTVIFVTGPGHLHSWLYVLLTGLLSGPAWASLLSLLGALALIAALIQLIRLIRHRKDG